MPHRRSSTSSDTRMSRPCSSHAYQHALTPERDATVFAAQALGALDARPRQPELRGIDASPATPQELGALLIHRGSKALATGRLAICFRSRFRTDRFGLRATRRGTLRSVSTPLIPPPGSSFRIGRLTGRPAAPHYAGALATGSGSAALQQINMTAICRLHMRKSMRVMTIHDFPHGFAGDRLFHLVPAQRDRRDPKRRPFLKISGELN